MKLSDEQIREAMDSANDESAILIAGMIIGGIVVASIYGIKRLIFD